MFSAISVYPFLFQIGRHSGKWIAGEEVKEKYCGVDPKCRVGSGVSVCLNDLLACFQHFHDTDEDDERSGLNDPRKQVDRRWKQASERLGDNDEAVHLSAGKA